MYLTTLMTALLLQSHLIICFICFFPKKSAVVKQKSQVTQLE